MTSHCSPSPKLWISALLVIIIISVLTAFAYTNSDNAIKSAAKLGMKTTAGVMATQINASELVGLEPGDELSVEYLAVAHKLRSMRSMNDYILNAYILKVNPDNTITFLVDDLYPADPQGSAKIGEVSTAPDSLEILGALSGPTTSKEPYTTKYGSFMSAYAPIDTSASDSGGNTYAVLAIDITAQDYMDYTSQGGLIILTGIISMILAVGAILYFGTKCCRDDEKV
ncbi:MAG: hypothetical protein M0Q91_04255 [Methanoregula sp.]|nr:hypothetical protein [Methanoregula sp.]